MVYQIHKQSLLLQFLQQMPQGLLGGKLDHLLFLTKQKVLLLIQKEEELIGAIF